MAQYSIGNMIALFICFLLLAIGYYRPQTIGWIFLLSAPFLASVSNLIFVNDASFPLRFNQAIFAVAIGVSCAPQNRSRLIDVLKRVGSLWLIVIFLAIEILYGFIEPNLQALKFIVMHQDVLYLAILALAFSLVRDEASLEYVYRAILFTGILIGIFAIIELSTGYNVSHHLCAINFSSCNLSGLHWAPTSLREGFYEPELPVFLGRYSGVTGDPNLTGNILGICLVCSFCSLNSLKKWKYYFFSGLLVIFVAVLFLSQVRAAIFTFFFISLAFSIFQRKVRYLMFSLFLIAVLILYFGDGAREWLFQFVESRLTFEEIFAEDQRLRGLQNAAKLFGLSYGLGVGGDIYTTSDVMLDSDDATQFILYFLVGGFILGLMNIAMLGGMFFSLIARLPRVPSGRQRAIIIFFVGGMASALISSIFYAGTVMFYILFLYATARASMLPKRFIRKSGA